MNRRRFRISVAALALVAGVTVLLLATELFPYHTTNHDEGVYLQQALALLDGQFSLYPPVAEAFRPWFFVRDGARLYPKYAPVPAATFAVGKLLGEFRLSLALVAAGNVALVAALVAEAIDRRTGVVAAAFVLGSPLFLVDSSVFLPYAPTTLWNLVFAVAYLRAARLADRRYAAVAGVAVGMAFFSRPYTAVLFALPFVAHALYSLAVGFSRDRLLRLSVTAVGGLAGVAATLAYNAAVTGSPWLFPYEAFAPRDGLGFGYREILGYGREYTPALALRANGAIVRQLFTEWIVAGPVGTLLAALGLGAFLRRAKFGRNAAFSGVQARAILAGLFVSIVAGNVYFWGNLNVLGALGVPDDGLIDTLGPYYHFDLLVPTAAFAAHGSILAFDHARTRVEKRTRRSRGVVASVALIGVVVLAGTTGAVLAPTLQDNAAITDEYEDAYRPFETNDLSKSVVFLPTPYGDWLGHPFQHLRNEPGFDGETVYALDGPDALAVASHYPNRTYYRYVYRGEWAPYRGDSVEPALRRVSVARGETVGVNATVGVPSHADRVSVRVATNSGAAYYAVNGTPSNLAFGLEVANDTARLTGAAVSPVGENASVSVGRTDELTAQIFVSDAAGGGFSYRLELPVSRRNGTVAALSPYREVCLAPDECNGEAAYVPDDAPPGVHVETNLYVARNSSSP